MFTYPDALQSIQNTISSSFKYMTYKETAYKETTVYDILYMTYIMFNS